MLQMSVYCNKNMTVNEQGIRFTAFFLELIWYAGQTWKTKTWFCDELIVVEQILLFQKRTASVIFTLSQKPIQRCKLTQ